MNKIADLVVGWPKTWITVFIVTTALMAAELPKATVDPSVKNQLPVDLPSRINLDRIEKIFGGTDMVLVVISAEDILQTDTLKRIRRISKGLKRISEFDKVLSLFTLKDIKGQEDTLLIDAAVQRIPKTEASRKTLRQNLRDNDLVYGSVISKDFRHTALICLINMQAKDEVVLKKIQEVLDKNPGPENVEIGGMPFVRINLGQDIRHDMRRFMPIGLLIMLVFLFICFRQLRGVLLPFGMTVMAIVVSMGMIPLFGWKIQMITVILPVILIAVANDYGIHMLARYQEDNTPQTTLTSKQLAHRGIVQLGKPIAATGITTICGLMCLISHIIIPAEQLGILASLGVAFALCGSLIFIPAVLSLLPRAKPVLDGHQAEKSTLRISLLDRALQRTALGVVKSPRIILVSIVIVVLAIGSGMTFLVVDTNPANYYAADAPVARATNLVNDNFGGSSAISIVAQGDIKSPQVMQEIDDFEQALVKHPYIDITSSAAKIIRRMNKVMHAGDPAQDRIPTKRNAIAQYFELYSASGDAEDLERLVDFDYQHAQLTARINESSTSAINQVVNSIKDYVADRPNTVFTLVGGFADLFSELVEQVIRGQVISLLLSLLLVGILVGMLFRSAIAGMLAVIPLALAMIMLFGLMGYLKIELNIATAMLSSIMIGVGVDYTIHFLWRYRSERNLDQTKAEAVRITLTTAGRGIVFNALSVVIGFVVLILSAFLPVQFFGILVVVCISACLVGALVLLPALCLIAQPRFLEPNSP